jgi:hypothetical protein
LTFELPFTRFTAIIGSVCLRRNGTIRSITLFPGETVKLRTAQGEITGRNGFSLHPSGALESMEPLRPVAIQTPIGTITAFDPDAVGVNADVNSLAFDTVSRVTTLTTTQNSIAAQTEDGRLLTFSPHKMISPLDYETLVTVGLRLRFDYEADTVIFEDAHGTTTLPLKDSGFTVLPYADTDFTCNPTACANCTLTCG